MFPTSTQCKHWMFSSDEELNKLRDNANLRHIQIYGKHVNVRLKCILTSCFKALHSLGFRQI